MPPVCQHSFQVLAIRGWFRPSSSSHGTYILEEAVNKEVSLDTPILCELPLIYISTTLWFFIAFIHSFHQYLLTPIGNTYQAWTSLSSLVISKLHEPWSLKRLLSVVSPSQDVDTEWMNKGMAFFQCPDIFQFVLWIPLHHSRILSLKQQQQQQ